MAVDKYSYDSPHVKTHLLFQAHFSRLTLPIADYVTDQKSVLDQAIRICQALLDLVAESGWLATTIRAVHLQQQVGRHTHTDGHTYYIHTYSLAGWPPPSIYSSRSAGIHTDRHTYYIHTYSPAGWPPPYGPSTYSSRSAGIHIHRRTYILHTYIQSGWLATTIRAVHLQQQVSRHTHTDGHTYYIHTYSPAGWPPPYGPSTYSSRSADIHIQTDIHTTYIHTESGWLATTIHLQQQVSRHTHTHYSS